MLTVHVSLLSMGCGCSAQRRINPSSEDELNNVTEINASQHGSWFTRNGTSLQLQRKRNDNHKNDKQFDGNLKTEVVSCGVDTKSLQSVLECDDTFWKNKQWPSMRISTGTQCSAIRRQDVAVNTDKTSNGSRNSSSSDSMELKDIDGTFETILPKYLEMLGNKISMNHVVLNGNSSLLMESTIDRDIPIKEVSKIDLNVNLKDFNGDQLETTSGSSRTDIEKTWSARQKIKDGHESQHIAVQTEWSLSFDDDVPELAAKPPKSRKVQLMEHCNCTDIDRHARKVPEDSSKTIWSLVKYFQTFAKSDLDIVRAFFVWITNNLRYELKLANIRQNTSEIMNENRAGVARHFCNLFSEMCSVVDVRVKQIRGFAKGFDYKPGHRFSPSSEDGSHIWNVVFIHGSWRFVDCTLGAGFLNTVGVFQQKFKDHYFLTDPDVFIWTHYPYNKSDDDYSRWQLLETSISLNEFNSRHRVTPHYFEYQMKMKKHLESPIVFSQSTEITLLAPEVMQYKYKLFSVDRAESGEFNQYVFCQLINDRLVGSFHVTPPIDGSYILKIYAHPERTLRSNTMLDCVIVLVLECIKTWKNVPKYPHSDFPWGSTRYFYEFGLRMINHSSPVVVIVSGRKTLIMETTQDMVFAQHLFDVAGDEVDTNKVALIRDDVTDDNIVKFLVRPPSVAFFKLEIYASPKIRMQRGSCCLQLVASLVIDCKQCYTSSEELREKIFAKSKNGRKARSTYSNN